MEFPEENYNDQAEFNQGIAIQMRLDIILRKINYYIQNQNWHSLFWTIQSLYEATFVYIDEKQIKEFEKLQFNAREAFSKYITLLNENSHSMPYKIIDAWLELSRQCQKLLQKKGMLMPLQKDARWGLATHKIKA